MKTGHWAARVLVLAAVLAYDLIVPPRSGKVRLASFCVEAGRWQQRGGEDARAFSRSAGQLPGKALRLAVSSARQQGQVWEKVKEQQEKLGRRLNKNVADPRPWMLSPSNSRVGGTNWSKPARSWPSWRKEARARRPTPRSTAASGSR